MTHRAPCGSHRCIRKNRFLLARFWVLARSFPEAGLHHEQHKLLAEQTEIDSTRVVGWAVAAMGMLLALPWCVRLAQIPGAFECVATIALVASAVGVGLRRRRLVFFSSGKPQAALGIVFTWGISCAFVILLRTAAKQGTPRHDFEPIEFLAIASGVILALAYLPDFVATLPARTTKFVDTDPYLSAVGLVHRAMTFVTFDGRKIVQTKALFAGLALVILTVLPVYDDWLRTFGALNLGGYDLPAAVSRLRSLTGRSLPDDFGPKLDLLALLFADKAVILLAYAWILGVAVTYVHDALERFSRAIPRLRDSPPFLLRWQPIWMTFFVAPSLVFVPIFGMALLNLFFGGGFAILLGAYGTAIIVPRILGMLYTEIAFALVLGATDEDLDRIDVNTASRAELMLLPGVGNEIAAAIIEARPLMDFQDLTKRVSRIGPARRALLSPLLRVSKI